MADFVTQQENNITDTSAVKAGETQDDGVQLVGKEEKQLPVVWTPRFIVLFFLTLAFGLSAESLFTQGWTNNIFRAEWIHLLHVLFILVVFVMLSVKSRSALIRLGAIAGCIWAVITSMSYIATLVGISAQSLVSLQFQAVTLCALVATFIPFSTHRIVFRRWDSLFFWLAPLLGVSIVAVRYVLSRNDPHLTRVLLGETATVLLYLCIAIWWLRPSCWRSQPCITFLFGLASLLLLCAPLIHNDALGTPFFLSQVLLLCILLGAMRVLQGEVRNYG